MTDDVKSVLSHITVPESIEKYPTHCVERKIVYVCIVLKNPIHTTQIPAAASATSHVWYFGIQDVCVEE